ncbi:type II toxin-antitoxin system TacA family antitoxin [Kibdelosporangium banguiense]|uniref:type II toxin-antitoxin system TacA family antitoxin n=1 Tax=Kibdelosporangium banguiense TaxID=1365924 RepID=UPI003559023D
MRVSRPDRQLIEDAAEHLNESVSDFTRNAALRRAEKVLARTKVTLMPAEQFDALLDSLDIADDAPALQRAFERPRRFERG